MAAEKVDRGRIEVNRDECKGCLLCVSVCPVHVIELDEGLNRQGYRPVRYAGSGCTGCGFCFYACPEPGAITVFRLARSA